MQKTSSDALRKKLIREERRQYLEGRNKSLTWEEAKLLVHNKNKEQSKNKSLDKEIALLLPFLNARQKRVVLASVKAFVSKQNSCWERLYREQREAIKAISTVKKTRQ